MTTGVPWKAISAALAVALVVIIVTAWWLWPRGGGGPSENVRFDYQMWFYYYGSEENVPLDNLSLGWSAPKVDNALPELLGGVATWQLWYIEEDNTLTLQATMAGTENLRGERSEQLDMYQFGAQYDQYGPDFTAWFDRLYSREAFVRVGYVVVDKENADKLTLKVHEQTAPIANWWAIGQENQAINFSIWVGLWRENVLVEQFVEIRENGLYGWYWLDPVS